MTTLSHPYQLYIKSEFYPQNGINKLIGMFETLKKAQDSILHETQTEGCCAQYIIKIDLNSIDGCVNLIDICSRRYKYIKDTLWTYSVKDVSWSFA
jgi:hypothetical protein